MPTFVRVLRPFSGAREYAAGEVINADNWRLVDKLVAQRYVRVVEEPRSRRTGKDDAVHVQRQPGD